VPHVTFTVREGTLDGPKIGTFEWNPAPGEAEGPIVGTHINVEGGLWRIADFAISGGKGELAVERTD